MCLVGPINEQSCIKIEISGIVQTNYNVINSGDYSKNITPAFVSNQKHEYSELYAHEVW